MSYHCSLSQFATPSKESKSRGAPMWLLARLRAEADRLFIYRHYSTLSDFCSHHSLTLPQRLRGGSWRLCTPPQVGHIHGLWSSWGMLTATNGVLCYIEQGEHGLFLGHLENWVQFKDEDEAAALDEDSRRSVAAITAITTRKAKAFAEFDL